MRRSHPEVAMRLESALTATSLFTPDKFDTFAKHLQAEWVEEALHATGTATLRKRRLPADRVVWLVLGMALMRDRPITDVVRVLDLAMPDRSSSKSMAPSGISQAKTRLGADPMEWLFMRSATQWAHASAAGQRWHDLALYGVDGSTLRVPDSVENREHFGGHNAGAGRGESGYPLMRLVALMALRSHLLVSVNFGPYGVDERSYASALWSALPDNSLTLVDRLYLQADVLVPIIRDGHNRHWLTRAKSKSKWRVLKTFGPGDDLVEIDVSRAARTADPSLPKTLNIRAIRYQIHGFAPQTLMTSLVDAKAYPADELRALYHERWELELGYDEIKTELLQREETIRSKSPGAVHQELFGILIAYNLIRLEMAAIAAEAKVDPTRVSFVAALRLIVEEWGFATITASPGAIPRHLGDLRDKIRRFILPPRRSDRAYPRAVKIKMSSYPRKRPSVTPAK